MSSSARSVRGEHEYLGLPRRRGVAGRGKELERKRLRGPAVARLVDGAAVAVPDDGEPLVVGEAGVGGRGGRRGCGGLRLRRQAQGEVVQREGEVRQLAALADESHRFLFLDSEARRMRSEEWSRRGRRNEQLTRRKVEWVYMERETGG
jgi:hypothetical protein